MLVHLYSEARAKHEEEFSREIYVIHNSYLTSRKKEFFLLIYLDSGREGEG
jgi:hypothetical protein